MATTRCPACGLTVPYFCCEGLVCPACGYDELQDMPEATNPGESSTPPNTLSQPLSSDSPPTQRPVQ